MAQTYKEFIDLLLEYLRNEDRSQSWLAEQIGVSRATVSNWITNLARPDSPEVVIKIANKLRLNEFALNKLLSASGYHYSLNTELSNIPKKESETTLDSALARLAALPTDHVPDIADPPIHSRVRFEPNQFFVGREKELMQLAAWIKGENGGIRGQVNTIAIMGMGGIGKTQLAVEFVYRYGQFFLGGVFWISCTDPTAIPIEMALCYEHLSKLDKDSASSESTNLVEKVRSIWQKPLPRLLIFDNCNKVEVLNEWRPKFGGCRVLITSRRHDWSPALGIRTLSLDTLDRSRSIDLLCQFSLAKRNPPYNEQERITLDEISRTLGDLPLALHLAGSFLANYGHVMPPTAYLDEVKNYKLVNHLSMQTDSDDYSPTEHDTSIANTFAISYKQLDLSDETDALAFDILLCGAHWCDGNRFSTTKNQLNLENMVEGSQIQKEDEFAVYWSKYFMELISWFIKDLISIDLLRGLIGKGHSPVQFESALRRLVNLGLIEREEHALVRLHPLVMFYIYSFDEAGNAWAKGQADNFQILVIGQCGMAVAFAGLGFVMGAILEERLGSPSSLIQKAREILYSHPKNLEEMNTLWHTLFSLEKPITEQRDEEKDIQFGSMLTYRVLSRLDAQWDQTLVDNIKANDSALDFVIAYNGRGGFNYNNGEYALARDDFTKAIELDPTFFVSYLNRGMICCIQGEPDQARLDFAMAVKFGFDPSPQLLKSNPEVTNLNKDEYKRTFLDYMKSQALIDYMKSIDIEYNLVSFYTQQGYAYLRQDKSTEALKIFSKAIELGLKDHHVYCIRGNYYREDQVERAIADYTRAIEIAPDYHTAYNNRGYSYYAQGDYLRAIEDFTKVIELVANEHDDFVDAVFAFQKRGNAYYNLRKYEQAIEDYTKAIELGIDYDAHIFINRGISYTEQGENELALADYNQALIVDSQLPISSSDRLSDVSRNQVEQLIKALETKKYLK